MTRRERSTWLASQRFCIELSVRHGGFTSSTGGSVVKEIAGFTVKELVVIGIVAAVIVIAFGRLSFLHKLSAGS